MGVSWRGGKDLSVVVPTIEGKHRAMMQEALGVMNEALDQAAVDMVHTIETVPSSLVPGKIGRVDTGLMRDSVEVEDMKPAGKNRWVGRMGWIDTQEDYFAVQEYGGSAPEGLRKGGGRRRISPMHALTGARIKAHEYLKGKFG